MEQRQVLPLWQPVATNLQKLTRLQQVAVLSWTVVVLVISVRALVVPDKHTVYPIFSFAAQGWLQGEDIYFSHDRHADLDAYRYSPAVAALLVPLSFLPDGPGSVLWRLINVAVLSVGFGWWCRRVAADGEDVGADHRAALWLLLLPLAVGSLNNAQANPLVIGLLLMAVAGCRQGRWNLAAVCLGLSTLLKVYPLALGLLLLLIHPRQLSWRLALALLAGLMLPFALQRPDYAASMYESWWRHLTTGDRSNLAIHSTTKDLWLLLRMVEAPLSRTFYAVIQLGSAAAVAALCLCARRKQGASGRLLTALTVLGTAWMMLCGPATESSTYVLFGPAVVWVAFEAFWRRRSPCARAAIVGILAVFFARPPLAAAGVTQPLAYATQPLATLGLVVYYLIVHLPELLRKPLTTESKRLDHRALAA